MAMFKKILGYIWKFIKWCCLAYIGIVIAAIIIFILIGYRGEIWEEGMLFEIRPRKFKFEDFPSEYELNRYMKKRYPEGSDVMEFIFDVTAAGAYCYEDKEKYVEDIEGQRRYRCYYVSAMMSEDFGGESLLIVTELNDHIMNIYTDKFFFIH